MDDLWDDRSLFLEEITELWFIPFMTYSSTLTSKNQTTLPKAVVALLGAKPSSVLSYETLEDGSVRLTAKASTFADHLDTFPKKKPTRKITVEMMNAVVETEAANNASRGKKS